MAVCLRSAVVARLRVFVPRLCVLALAAPVGVLIDRLRARGDVDRADPELLSVELVADRDAAEAVIDSHRPVIDVTDDVLTRWRS